MSRRLIFLTHAEVEIDPAVAVTDWGLSDQGRARHAQFAASGTVAAVGSVYASAERKSQEGAASVCARLDLPLQIVGALGENDRSATGYLPGAEFEATADRFFAHPDESIRGWERARAAQARIVAAVRTIADLDRGQGDILIVAHGGVGALLRCHLMGIEITRDQDQPAGGGCWFETRTGDWPAPTGWSRI